MPGLMRSWFDPTRPKPPRARVTQNITNMGGAGPGGSASSAAPGVSADQYTANETARYQQMLAGLGMGQEGNQLPQGIQENINRQASLIG